ncbi:hypothetical protein LCGC14_2046680 [marine sediment metagenome]|uniref:site-specific DNA-methyltransferase (cytosine-N(4)-specific) n=1 Tax=marine sediment metagenome TaxID=412755 RepID=A0A0F9EQG3_9ZZZZ
MNEKMVVDIISGDARHIPFPDKYFHCAVTSPPYWGLRDYGLGPDSLGLEPTPEVYVQHLVDIFREVRRTLRDDGTLWLIIGDSYAGSGKGRMGDGTHAAKHGEKQHTNTGTLLGNLSHGFSDNDLKPKDLVGIPWMVAFALRADGWYLRSDIIWHKPNVMPESVQDRPTKAHEYLFLLSKSKKYYYDADAIREPTIGTNHHDLTDPSYQAPGQTRQTGSRGPASHKGSHFNRGKTAEHQLGRASSAPRQDNPIGRNKRSVWNIATQPYPGAHFAVFPEKLVGPCILAGCPEGGVVLDPFAGAGTVGVVVQKLGRNAVLIDAKPEYCKLALERIK